MFLGCAAASHVGLNRGLIVSLDASDSSYLWKDSQKTLPVSSTDDGIDEGFVFN